MDSRMIKDCISLKISITLKQYCIKVCRGADSTKQIQNWFKTKSAEKLKPRTKIHTIMKTNSWVRYYHQQECHKDKEKVDGSFPSSNL